TPTMRHALSPHAGYAAHAASYSSRAKTVAVFAWTGSMSTIAIFFASGGGGGALHVKATGVSCLSSTSKASIHGCAHCSKLLLQAPCAELSSTCVMKPAKIAW